MNIITIGPPPAPAVNPITVVDDNGELLISWSQSNCAVQYVVTVINSSDDRVYPNITTSNTNTTVTLPTGVEFCVTLVAVDSVGRRGPDSAPMCYGNGENWCHIYQKHMQSCPSYRSFKLFTCSVCNLIFCESAAYIISCCDQH